MPMFQPRFTTHFAVIGHTDRDVPYFTGKVIDGPVAETAAWLNYLLRDEDGEGLTVVDHFPDRDAANWGPALPPVVDDWSDDLPF